MYLFGIMIIEKKSCDVSHPFCYFEGLIFYLPPHIDASLAKI